MPTQCRRRVFKFKSKMKNHQFSHSLYNGKHLQYSLFAGGLDNNTPPNWMAEMAPMLSLTYNLHVHNTFTLLKVWKYSLNIFGLFNQNHQFSLYRTNTSFDDVMNFSWHAIFVPLLRLSNFILLRKHKFLGNEK